MFLSLFVQVKNKKMDYKFSMRSPVEIHKIYPDLTKKMSLRYETCVLQVNFQILRLLFEIASLVIHQNIWWGAEYVHGSHP